MLSKNSSVVSPVAGDVGDPGAETLPCRPLIDIRHRLDKDPGLAGGCRDQGDDAFLSAVAQPSLGKGTDRG